ncbi:hypothetical protein [Campylobacter sputorum]|nr:MULTISPECIES: hypothetical protein [Campylobacter]
MDDLIGYKDDIIVVLSDFSEQGILVKFHAMQKVVLSEFELIK